MSFAKEANLGLIASHVTKSIGAPPISILTDISIEVRSGEFLALTGRSGSGKSTLLYLISSLDLPTSGEVEIDGMNVKAASSDKLHRFRNESIGFVFQFHYLLNELTVLENILMPTLKFDRRDQSLARATSLLDRVGLSEKLHRFPRELSGGEQQRAAIARALVMKPKYLFADEPTGSLDTLNGNLVMDIIAEENRDGTTVIMVTHDSSFAARAQRRIQLSDGRVVD